MVCKNFLMGCNDPEHRERFLAWLHDRVVRSDHGISELSAELEAALVSGNPKDLSVSIWREWYDYMNPGWKEETKAKGGFQLPFSSEPQHKEKFLDWLKNKIRTLDYIIDDNPYGIQDALRSGSPEDLEIGLRLCWEDWFYDRDASDYQSPKMQQRTGPRGGNYTEATTKDGRPYRRYF